MSEGEQKAIPTTAREGREQVPNGRYGYHRSSGNPQRARWAA